MCFGAKVSKPYKPSSTRCTPRITQRYSGKLLLFIICIRSISMLIHFLDHYNIGVVLLSCCIGAWSLTRRPGFCEPHHLPYLTGLQWKRLPPGQYGTSKPMERLSGQSRTAQNMSPTSPIYPSP